MVVEHGIIDAQFTACASIDEAIDEAKAGGGVAWIGLTDPTFGELEDLVRRLDLGQRALVELEQRRRTPRAPRARISSLARGAHLVVVGFEPGSAGGARVRGHLELFATSECVAVLATDLPAHRQPPALRRRLERSLQEVDHLTGGAIVGLAVSSMLDWYEELLDLLEDESVRLADELFERRDERQLRRIYELSRPVHAATVALDPLIRGSDELVDGGIGGLEVALARPLRSEIRYLSGRLARLDALLTSAQQSYFNLAQDEANRLTERQGDVTRQMSGYALLIAIPTIVFSLYGTNFDSVPLIGATWGYGVMLGATVILCFIAWRRLRAAGWI